MLKDTCSSLVFTGGLFVFILNLLTVATPQNNIIESLEAEILKLKTELSESEEKYRKVKVELDKMTKKWGFIV